jgi:hypothetical protein
MPSPEDYLSDQPQRTGLKASQQTAEVLSGLMQPSDIVTQRRQEQGEAEQARRDAVEAGLRGPALRRYLDDFRAYQESKRQ